MYEFRAAKVPPEYIFDLLPPIRPRGFSISSSPAVRRPSCLTLRRGGELVTVCARSPTPARSTSSSPSSSTRRSSLSRAKASRRRTSPLFLPVRHTPCCLTGTRELHCTASSLTFHHVGARPAGARLPIRFDTSGQLKLPAGTPPLIMVGPGTGVAPFRASWRSACAPVPTVCLSPVRSRRCITAHPLLRRREPTLLRLPLRVGRLLLPPVLGRARRARVPDAQHCAVAGSGASLGSLRSSCREVS